MTVPYKTGYGSGSLIPITTGFGSGRTDSTGAVEFYSVPAYIKLNSTGG